MSLKFGTFMAPFHLLMHHEWARLPASGRG